jgi:transglutaminase-like putative cysteine protease
MVSTSHHRCFFRPSTSGRQECDQFLLEITPAPASRKEQIDFFGNTQTHFHIDTPHTKLVIEATSTVTTGPPNFPEPSGTATCESVRAALVKPNTTALLQAALMAQPTGTTRADEDVAAALVAYAAPHFAPDRPYLEAASAFSSAIFHDFTFDSKATDVSTPVTEVFKIRRGVCQDFAHLALTAFRALGLPARYESGYIRTTPPPGKPRLIGADASHAWISVFLPETGWTGLDPTNNKPCDEDHIHVASGRDYHDVAPIRGAVTGGSKQELNTEVTVLPEGEIAVPRRDVSEVSV